MRASDARRLIHVPIVHAKADLGNMGDSVKDFFLRKEGQEGWERHSRTIDEMWRRVREEIEALGLDYRTVRLYQDGLPNCGREAEIVGELAAAGSPNHRLLLDLMQQGAKLVGAESPELLLEEYKLAQQSLLGAGSSHAKSPADRQREIGRQILAKRDSYIAERIAQTLHVGEAGLLFLGVLHSLAGRLPRDIRIVRLTAHLNALRTATANKPERRP